MAGCPRLDFANPAKLWLPRPWAFLQGRERCCTCHEIFAKSKPLLPL